LLLLLAAAAAAGLVCLPHRLLLLLFNTVRVLLRLLPARKSRRHVAVARNAASSWRCWRCWLLDKTNER
jgi:hypothetical protein